MWFILAFIWRWRKYAIITVGYTMRTPHIWLTRFYNRLAHLHLKSGSHKSKMVSQIYGVLSYIQHCGGAKQQKCLNLRIIYLITKSNEVYQIVWMWRFDILPKLYWIISWIKLWWIYRQILKKSQKYNFAKNNVQTVFVYVDSCIMYNANTKNLQKKL